MLIIASSRVEVNGMPLLCLVRLTVKSRARNVPVVYTARQHERDSWVGFGQENLGNVGVGVKLRRGRWCGCGSWDGRR